MIIVRRHKKQHYSTLFCPNTGFFARIEDEGHPEPFWCENGPELMDIGITNWCDRGCSFCYRSSDTDGQHISLRDYDSLIRQARQLGVHQVALGGGNPNQHPEFESILQLTRKGNGIVPSYTTNGRGLTPSVLDATLENCGAVAVSAYAPFEESALAIQKLIQHGITTNVHLIIDRKGVDLAIRWMQKPPAWLQGINALIMLNYKPVVRVGDHAPLAKLNPNIEKLFNLATTVEHPFKIGFDDCSATGVLTYGDADLRSVEGCDSGRFSMFVSENMEAYPCSFMSELCSGHPVTDTNLREIWQTGELFVKMRESLSPKRCGNCHSGNQCMSGCPLFPEINICGSRQDTTTIGAKLERGPNLVQISVPNSS